MADKMTNRGLQVIAERASIYNSDGAGLQKRIQSMSVDDSATVLGSGTTNLGSPTNKQVNNLDATPVRTLQSVLHTMTLTAGQYVGSIIKRVILHNETGGSVTGTSDTVVCGSDGQSITKGSWSLVISQAINYTTTT